MGLHKRDSAASLSGPLSCHVTLCWNITSFPSSYARTWGLSSTWSNQTLSCGFPGHHQCFLWCWSGVTEEGVQLLHYRGHCLVMSIFAGASQASPPATGIVINMEKSDLELTNLDQFLRMLIDTIQESVCLTVFHITRLLDVADMCLHPLSLPVKIWHQILDHVASMERFVPKDQDKIHSCQWQPKSHWTASVDGSSNTSPFFGRVPTLRQMMTAGEWWPS